MQRPQIHIITDITVQDRFSHFQLAEMAFAGGADVVQYRNKDWNPLRDREELQRIIAIPRKNWQKLIINDDPFLAHTVMADGVHVGAEDASPVSARNLLGVGAFIGATVHDQAELDKLAGIALDYIGVGPVFGTTSKQTGLPPLGLEGLEALCRVSTFPVIAVGSVSRQNARSVIDAGAAGVAIISDICCAQNPQKAVEELREILA